MAVPAKQDEESVWLHSDRVAVRDIRESTLSALAYAVDMGNAELLDKCHKLLKSLVTINQFKKDVREIGPHAKNLSVHLSIRMDMSGTAVYKKLDSIGLKLEDFTHEERSVRDLFFKSELLKELYTDVLASTQIKATRNR